MSERVALIPGTTGVVGRRVAEHLATEPGWRVLGIARRPPAQPRGYEVVALDLTDDTAVRAAAPAFASVTHIFHCGRYPHSKANAEPIAENLAMLRNVVEACESVASPLAHVHLVQGSKYYGSELGPYKTPAKESDPRIATDNWYYAQEDWTMARARGKHWSWSSSRPHGICDHAPGIARSMAMVISVYAAIMKELGEPLHFPGTEANYRALYQCTDATLLARAMAWMGTEPRCAGEAFNVTNGDYIRWMHLWPRFAEFFGMRCGDVRTLKLAAAMPEKKPVWERIVARHGLVTTPYEQVALWPYGDFIFTPGYDIMSDTNKLRRYGFWETRDTGEMFLELFEQFRRDRAIP